MLAVERCSSHGLHWPWTKRHFVEGTLGKALHEEPRPGAKRKLTGQEEALLVATACSRPPQGRARWTIELLAREMVRLTEHDSVSREIVRRRLAENELKPWREKMWCVPKIDGEYVARMEDVLDLYAEPLDMDVHDREGPHQNGPRLPQTSRYPRPARQKVIITVPRN